MSVGISSRSIYEVLTRRSRCCLRVYLFVFVLVALVVAGHADDNSDESPPQVEQLKPVLLDYSLYAQLLHELSDEPDVSAVFEDEQEEQSDRASLAHDRLVNYFKLNQESLRKYNEYLHFSEAERLRLRDLAKSMFEFGYDSYMNHAFPMDELDPINCRGRGPDLAHPENININDVLGDYMLALVDTLPTLAVIGNSSEFQRAARLVISQLNFDKDSTVQVFEATIRVLGGLLSAHLIVIDEEQPFGDMRLPNYNNELLELAHDLAIRLLQAFENPSNIPYPRVNLKYGVPSNTFNHTCTSGAGTLLLEFGMLSRLLDDPVYERVARKAVEAIYSLRCNSTGLFGNEIHIHTREWLGKMSGLGAGLDSFYEYLIKSYILFGDPKDYDMFNEVERSLKLYLRRGRAECLSGNGHHPLYINVNMNDGKIMNNWVDSLQAFFPGVQVLNGDLDEAICFHALYFAIWKKFGVLPERFNWNMKLPDVNFYPLRPEFAESTYFLYRATRNPFYLHVAKSIIENIYTLTKVRCGFATVHDVIDKSLEDRMESFFLSETMKYLYLTFDHDHYLNNLGDMKYVFTTEGHIFPIEDIAAREKEPSMDALRPTLTTRSAIPRNATVANRQDNSSSRRPFSMRKKYKLYERPPTAPDPLARLIFTPRKCSFGTRHDPNASSPANFYKNLLPMKIKYFDQLFELVGVGDNLDSLLERKTS